MFFFILVLFKLTTKINYVQNIQNDVLDLVRVRGECVFVCVCVRERTVQGCRDGRGKKHFFKK